MFEFIALLVVLIFIAFMARWRPATITSAKVDQPTKRPRGDKSAAKNKLAELETLLPKPTKIKWRPHVRVREYYKDGTVADVAPAALTE